MENDENTPPAVGRYTAVTRQPKRPAQQTRTPWHCRKPKQKAPPKPSNLIQKTPSANVVLRRVRQAATKEATTAALKSMWALAQELAATSDTNRTPTWWYRYLLQKAKSDQSKREINLWNVFVHEHVRARNDELPPGEERLTASKYVAELREIWNAMTKEERVEATKDAIEEVKQMRAARENSVHNVPIAAFHDVRANVRSIEQELGALHNRTGVEALLVVVRTDDNHLNHLHAFATSERVIDFFQGAYGVDVAQVGQQLESYCLSGVEGLRTTKFEALLKLKAQTADLIKKKLVEAAHPDQIGRMNYTSFETSITDRYGIIIEGWPLERFTCPSSINCKVSIEILHAAWANGTARFRRLTPEELRTRKENRRAELNIVATAAATSSVAVADQAVSFDPSVLDPALRDPAEPAPSDVIAAPATCVPDMSMPAVQEEPSQAVFTVTGATLVPAKKRKVRSDKGQKRGSYKKSPAAPTAPA